MSSADPERTRRRKNNGYLSTLVNYQHICLRPSPPGRLTAQHTKYINLTGICSTSPYWICWHHLNTNCQAVCHNSYFDKAHKAVFSLSLRLHLCVRLLVSAGVCRVTQSARRCLSLKCRRQSCWTARWEKWDYSYLFLWRGAERQRMWFCIYFSRSYTFFISSVRAFCYAKVVST